jgi:hypothetical protein
MEVVDKEVGILQEDHYLKIGGNIRVLEYYTSI